MQKKYYHRKDLSLELCNAKAFKKCDLSSFSIELQQRCRQNTFKKYLLSKLHIIIFTERLVQRFIKRVDMI